MQNKIFRRDAWQHESFMSLAKSGTTMEAPKQAPKEEKQSKMRCAFGHFLLYTSYSAAVAPLSAHGG